MSGLLLPEPEDLALLEADAAAVRPWNHGVSTGVGSLPGRTADEAARTVAGEVPDLPFLAELPGRGAGADLIGRAVSLLVDLHGEVVPSGWRLTSRAGHDERRASDYLNWDLDAALEHYRGAEWVKVQVCGPWTLAAGLELRSGNRALTDDGAVADLSESLAEGVRRQVADLERRLPGTSFVVQVDEPWLPAVLAGSLPTASGFGTVRSVDPARAGAVLAPFVAAFGDRPVIAHCCHPSIPIRLLVDAGFGGLSLDVTTLGSRAARLDPLGEALEAGIVLLAGVLPSTAPSGRPQPLRDWAAPLLELWNRLGLNRSGLTEVVPTTTCGLAGASPEWAAVALKRGVELARAFQDLPEGW